MPYAAGDPVFPTNKPPAFSYLPLSKQPTLKKESNRKKEIRHTATNLFKERGYKATSMRDLASEIGIEPASLYNHIKSKEEILKEICFDLAGQFLAAQEKIGKELEAEELLQERIKAHVKVILKNQNASAVFLNEWRFLEGDNLQEFKNQRKQYEQIFIENIEKGIETNVFKNVDVKFYIFTLFSSTDWLYKWYKKDGKYQAEDISKMLIHLLFDGLKK